MFYSWVAETLHGIKNDIAEWSDITGPWFCMPLMSSSSSRCHHKVKDVALPVGRACDMLNEAESV